MTEIATQVRPLASGVTVTPVQYLDLQGVQEDVLWAIGRASRQGQLVRAEPVSDNGDGTVTARLHYTGDLTFLPTGPLALSGPGRSRPVLTDRNRWDSWDYFSAGLKVVTVGLVAAAGYMVYLGLVAVATWIAAHIMIILGVPLAILALMFLMSLGGGGGCVGIHCGGCRG